jgi:hypothetical protein
MWRGPRTTVFAARSACREAAGASRKRRDVARLGRKEGLQPGSGKRPAPPAMKLIRPLYFLGVGGGVGVVPGGFDGGGAGRADSRVAPTDDGRPPSPTLPPLLLLVIVFSFCLEENFAGNCYALIQLRVADHRHRAYERARNEHRLVFQRSISPY